MRHRQKTFSGSKRKCLSVLWKSDLYKRAKNKYGEASQFLSSLVWRVASTTATTSEIYALKFKFKSVSSTKKVGQFNLFKVIITFHVVCDMCWFHLLKNQVSNTNTWTLLSKLTRDFLDSRDSPEENLVSPFRHAFPEIGF